MRGLSLVAANGGHSSSRCADLSLSWPLVLRNTGSKRAGSVVVAHGPSCSAARGIFPDHGSSPCPLHWQADSQPLSHQGSPKDILYLSFYLLHCGIFGSGCVLVVRVWIGNLQYSLTSNYWRILIFILKKKKKRTMLIV